MINLKELMILVNQFDTEMGVNIKEKRRKRKPRKDYNRILELIQSQLYLDICLLADMPISTFIKNKKEVSIKNKITIKLLCELSPIFKDGERASSLSSELFRKQFSIALMVFVANHLNSIVKGMVNKNPNKIDIDELMILYLHELYNVTRKTVKCILDRKNYQEDLFKLYRLISYRRIEGDYLNKKVFHDLEYLYDTIKHIETFGADIRLDEMIQFSYMSALNGTLKTKVFKNDISLSKEKEIIKVIRKLGKQVLTKWNDVEARPDMISIFMACCPMMYYRFNNINDDIYLNYGCKLLLFTEFMTCKNKDIIDSLITA